MTKIKLGCGADAVEVEDRARVPLTYASARAIISRLGDGTIVVCQHPGRWLSVDPTTGKSGHYENGGYEFAIDLAALRREQAPQVIGGWTRGIPPRTGASYELAACQHHSQFERADTYWTHRPGNTPEKQAAFDAAVNAWVIRVRDHISGPCTNPETVEMWHALRALGYGAA